MFEIGAIIQSIKILTAATLKSWSH